MVADIPQRPTSFMVSVVAGILGAIFLLAGVLTGSNPVYGAGYVMGVVSLVAALAWRSQLIRDWRANRR